MSCIPVLLSHKARLRRWVEDRGSRGGSSDSVKDQGKKPRVLSQGAFLHLRFLVSLPAPSNSSAYIRNVSASWPACHKSYKLTENVLER